MYKGPELVVYLACLKMSGAGGSGGREVIAGRGQGKKERQIMKGLVDDFKKCILCSE